MGRKKVSEEGTAKFSFLLPLKTAHHLSELALSEGVNPSILIRRSVFKFLGENPDETPIISNGFVVNFEDQVRKGVELAARLKGITPSSLVQELVCEHLSDVLGSVRKHDSEMRKKLKELIDQEQE